LPFRALFPTIDYAPEFGKMNPLKIRECGLMEFRSIHTIETGDNVHLKVELAGLANRVFAFGIDGLLMLALMGVVFIAFAALAYARSSDEIAKTGVPIGMFVVFFGYHLFQEWLWNGKTVGKAVFNIRVVRNNGQPIGFWESMGRNLLRVLDVYVSGIGLLCMMFNRSEKRFGDYIAGTIVVNDQPVLKPVWQRHDAEAELETPATETAVVRMSPEEAELLNAYRTRRNGFLAAARARFADALYRHFSERWHATVTSDADLDTHLDAYQQGLHQL
jgi:uncharacterized RDD family membrane protein YckC